MNRKALLKGKIWNWMPSSFLDGFVIVELADPDDLAGPVQIVPASERLLLGPRSLYAGK